MKNNTIKFIFSFFLIILYAALLYIEFFEVQNIGDYETSTIAVIFQGIGLLVIIGIMLFSIYFGKAHIGHKTAIIAVTVIYSVILDFVNIFHFELLNLKSDEVAYAVIAASKPLLTYACVTLISKSSLLIFNMTLMMVYFLSVLPMIYMGIRNINNMEEK